MENRFGFKDFLLFVFLTAVIVVILLAMKQNDRQFMELQRVNSRLADIDSDLNHLQVSAPAATGPTGMATTNPTAPSTEQADVFRYIRQAEKMPGYARGDWLVSSAPNSDKITPLVSGDEFAADVQSNVLDTLVNRDEQTLDWVPQLALSVPKIEDNSGAYFKFIAARKAKGETEEQAQKEPDCPIAATITFDIRPNVTFSDGFPLTADDIAWTFNWIMNPDVDDPRDRSALDKIKDVVAVNDHEVTFQFREPYFDSMGLAGGLSILPKHFYSKYSVADFNKSTGLLLGSGPYQMEDPTGWTPGNPVVLVRNDRYWGVPPAFNRMVFKIIELDLARLTAFRNGEIDEFGAQPEQYEKLIQDPSILSRTNHFVYSTAVGGYRYIAWNELKDGKPTFFADKRVRQAMTMLTDRQTICKVIMLGYATPITGPFSPLGKQNNPDVKPWPFDISAAVNLLHQAGFKADDRGLLHGPDGKPFEFKLTYPSGSANYDRIALFLKDAYGRAGIAMTPDPLDWSVFSDHLKKRDFDAISLGWSQGIEDDIYQMFDSSQMIGDGDDFISYKNPELDRLIEKARQTLDETKRMAMWRQCHAIIAEDQPYTFLFTRKSLEFIDKRIHNVHQVTLGLNSPYEWFVPLDQQKYK